METRIGLTIAAHDGRNLCVSGFLGRGAFGEVFQCDDVRSGEVFATKFIQFSSPADDRAVLAFQNEARLATQVNHPNVVRVFHVELNQNVHEPYLVMEFIPGGNLQRLLDRQRQANRHLDIDFALRVVVDVIQGAQAINSVLVHRDIKPDNVLGDSTPFKISDFGIAKMAGAATRPQTFKGGQHVFYMAPEAWRNETNTEKLDLYSVGLLAYELLTLVHPLRSEAEKHGDMLAGWRAAHLHYIPQDPRAVRPEVPPPVAQLIMSMVSKRPDERPSWSDALSIIATREVTEKIDSVIQEAIEAATTRHRQLEARKLDADRRRERAEDEQRSFELSCREIAAELRKKIDQFNSASGLKALVEDGLPRRWVCKMPNDRLIACEFFEREGVGIQLPEGELIGGGWLGIRGGRSMNLLLVRRQPGDAYLGTLTAHGLCAMSI